MIVVPLTAVYWSAIPVTLRTSTYVVTVPTWFHASEVPEATSPGAASRFTLELVAGAGAVVGSTAAYVIETSAAQALPFASARTL